jgi:hypothetical protein
MINRNGACLHAPFLFAVRQPGVHCARLFPLSDGVVPGGAA